MTARRRPEAFFQQARIPERRVSRGTIALLGGLCAVAVILSGVMIAGFVVPDQSKTASVATPPLLDEAPLQAGGEIKPLAPAPAQSAIHPVPVRTAAVASTPKVDRPVPVVAAPQNQPAAAEPPAANDTRWGATVTAQPEAAQAPDAAQQQLAAGPDERGSTQPRTAAPASEILMDLKTDPAPDTAATASISATMPDDAADVQVAESEAEVARLEASTGMIEGQAATDQQAASTELLPAMKTARVTKYVNLRAGPADEARVIAVVPANAEVKVESGCQWCTVVYNGQRGYIYKSFIRRSLKEAAAEGTGLF